MEEIEELRELAERFRRLALLATSVQDQLLLLEMADNLKVEADVLEEAIRPTS